MRTRVQPVGVFEAKRRYAVSVVDETLTRLAGVDPKKAALVELRFFGGLTFEEAATALGVSLATVKRDWALARAWLYRELSGS